KKQLDDEVTTHHAGLENRYFIVDIRY
ncbi:MAG: hypothetical protein RL563_1972, partial [Pseudomonadota bacterium]